MEKIVRCAWAQKPIFHTYHDTEWGAPVHNDRIHFEFLVLEAAQAGLSWETVLKKRQAYHDLFAHFDPVRVAQFTVADVERLMGESGIIRNRAKIMAAIKNAQIFLSIQKEFGSFDAYIWSFVGERQIVNQIQSSADYLSRSIVSDALSLDLKNRGCSFVGTTIMYAHLQAVGIINDHEVCCFRKQACMQ